VTATGGGTAANRISQFSWLATDSHRIRTLCAVSNARAIASNRFLPRGVT